MKKLVAVILSLSLVLMSCAAIAETAAPQVELTVFAAASMTESLQNGCAERNARLQFRFQRNAANTD